MSHPSSSRHHLFFVAGVMAVAAVFRVVALDRYPLPLHQDELSDIYDGYSLATTGADRSGERWPILVRGMGPGDYHPGMYAYLAMISAHVLGFSVAGGRLPAAIAGVLTVWLVYLAASRIMDRRGAMLALLFVALSPIHIQYSRQAHQGVCLVPFFVILIVWLVLRAIDAVGRQGQRAWISWALAGLAVGVSTNAYAGQRVTALLLTLFVPIVIAWTMRSHDRSWRAVCGAVAMFALAVGVGAAPQIAAWVGHPEEFLARGRTTFYDTDHSLAWWARRLANNLWLNVEPGFLFLNFGDYRLLSVARLSVIGLPFFYVGMAALLHGAAFRLSARHAVLLAAIAFSLLPGIATEGNPSPMRTSGVWALYPMVMAIGVQVCGMILRSVSTWRERGGVGRLLTPLVTHPTAVSSGYAAVSLTILGSAGFDIGRYLSRPELHGPASQHHLVRIGERLAPVWRDFDRVYVDTKGLFPCLYIPALAGMTPREMQTAPREGEISGYGWERFRRIGPFRFASLTEAAAEWNDSPRSERWLVVSESGATVEFSAAGQSPAGAAWVKSAVTAEDGVGAVSRR